MVRPEEERTYAEVVRAHRMDTVAYVLADAGDCLGIRDDEVANVSGRNLVPVDSENLPDLDPEGSWALAAIVCPGETVEALAAWADARPREDLERVWVYLHRDVDPRRAMAPWAKADLPPVDADIVADFPTFHRRFGNDLNDRIYADWVGEG